MKNTKLFCKKFFTWRLAFPTNKTLLTCVWKKHNILKTASEIHWQEISKQLKECVMEMPLSLNISDNQFILLGNY